MVNKIVSVKSEMVLHVNDHQCLSWHIGAKMATITDFLKGFLFGEKKKDYNFTEVCA